MELYLLKSGACLALLLLFYKLLLERQNMHTLKRFYLLFSVVVSFLIPFINFTTYVEVPPQAGIEFIEYKTADTENIAAPEISYLPYVLWGIYLVGVFFFGSVFILNLRSLFLRIRGNPNLKDNSVVNVLLEEPVAPHTFWRYIFLNREDYEKQRIPPEVFAHEHAHVNQKHSLDILFIELVQVLLWFNPLVYLAKNAIKLNHEFLADEAVLQKGVDTTAYQQILLAFSSNAHNISLANSINYLIIKKRFTVMKKRTLKRAVWLRSALILPLLAGLIYGFSTTEVVQEQNESTVKTYQVQEEATPEMIKEYNMLAKHYNSLPEDYVVTNLKHFSRMKYIYSLMTEEQKKNAEKMPDSQAPPLPPAPVDPPTPPAAKGDAPPPPPPPDMAEKVSREELPVPPPSPVEHMKELAKKKNSSFYYEHEEISAEEAIELTKKNKNLRIHVTKTSPASWNVQIFDKKKNP